VWKVTSGPVSGVYEIFEDVEVADGGMCSRYWNKSVLQPILAIDSVVRNICWMKGER